MRVRELDCGQNAGVVVRERLNPGSLPCFFSFSLLDIRTRTLNRTKQLSLYTTLSICIYTINSLRLLTPGSGNHG